MQPLEYASPMTSRRRPGILTAVGVLSIVFASLSALGSAGSVFSGVMYIQMTKSVQSATATVTVTPSTNPSAPGAPATPNITFHVSSGASELSIVEGSLSLCVAILLLVAGILVLRDSPLGARLHWIFVLLKFPLIIVAAFATWWTTSSLFSSIAQTPGGANTNSFANSAALLQALFMAALSMIYPIALMIVFSRRTIKDYIKTIQAADSNINGGKASI